MAARNFEAPLPPAAAASSTISSCPYDGNVEYLVIIVIINHLKNATQQEHLHVQYVGGQML